MKSRCCPDWLAKLLLMAAGMIAVCVAMAAV
jgi:hypothetical protein